MAGNARSNQVVQQVISTATAVLRSERGVGGTEWAQEGAERRARVGSRRGVQERY